MPRVDFQIPYHLYLEKYGKKYLTLYHALRDAIVSGKLAHGMQMPPTRELAEMYQVSRGIVSQVYEMLAAEGYLTSHVGQGTFVSFQHRRHEGLQADARTILLSEWGQRVESGLSLPPLKKRAGNGAAFPVEIDFGIGRTDTDAFPTAEWNRLLYGSVREMLEKQREEEFAAQGHGGLRDAIARYLKRARGLDVAAEDVVVVNGSMQAIALLAQLLVNPGDAVVMEDPGYRGIREAMAAVGGEVIPAPVDACGIQVADWEARLLFVTPSRQFPTGAVLSLERRQELLQWAARRNAVIVEDVYDSEFRYQGRPIEPLKALDRSGRVVYLGTFSKTMFSDIRIGYAVVPAWLRSAFVKARYLYEPHPTSLLQQRALAQFMNSGQYERHLRRMKRVYGQKHRLCVELLQERLGEWFEFVESDAGLHVFGWWKGSVEGFEAFLEAGREVGVRVPDARGYLMRWEGNACMFGFAGLSEEEIREGIGRLGSMQV